MSSAYPDLPLPWFPAVPAHLLNLARETLYLLADCHLFFKVQPPLRCPRDLGPSCRAPGRCYSAGPSWDPDIKTGKEDFWSNRGVVPSPDFSVLFSQDVVAPVSPQVLHLPSLQDSVFLLMTLKSCPTQHWATWSLEARIQEWLLS